MKKKLLIAAAICASLFVVMPMTNVSAAEVDAEAQGQSAQSDIAVTPCADEIVTKFSHAQWSFTVSSLESDQRILGG